MVFIAKVEESRSSVNETTDVHRDSLCILLPTICRAKVMG